MIENTWHYLLERYWSFIVIQSQRLYKCFTSNKEFYVRLKSCQYQGLDCAGVVEECLCSRLNEITVITNLGDIIARKTSTYLGKIKFSLEPKLEPPK